MDCKSLPPLETCTKLMVELEMVVGGGCAREAEEIDGPPQECFPGLYDATDMLKRADQHLELPSLA